jgi:hypothetical protein
MNKNEELINKIAKIRVTNNKNWMDILRLAFRENDKEAQKIMNRITQCDQQISLLCKELGKSKR